MSTVPNLLMMLETWKSWRRRSLNNSLNYPLVNVYKKRWKDPPCYSWENSRNQWPFSIAMLNYQRVPSWKRIGTLPFFCTFEMLKFDQMRTPTNAQPCQCKPFHGRTQKGQVLYVHSPQESHKLVGFKKKKRTLLPPPWLGTRVLLITIGTSRHRCGAGSGLVATLVAPSQIGRNPFSLLPIGSMYAIYGNIYHQYIPNVAYIPYMDPMGYEISPCKPRFSIESIGVPYWGFVHRGMVFFVCGFCESTAPIKNESRRYENGKIVWSSNMKIPENWLGQPYERKKQDHL